MANRVTWERATDLSTRAIKVASGVDFPRGDHWPTLVTVSLNQGNWRLDSSRILLDRDDIESATILVRSLFELAVNLSYIAQNVSSHLPDYLRHGGVPTTPEEVEELRLLMEGSTQPNLEKMTPGRTWRTLKSMCVELGSSWLDEYKTFYRFASIPTHAGSFTIASNFLLLLNQEKPTVGEKVGVLGTALAFHLRLAGVAAEVFPDQIDSKKIQDLVLKSQALGEDLAKG